MNNIPSIRIKCACGHEWLQAIAPWEVAWSSWEETKCSQCQKSPTSYVWHPPKPFQNQLQEDLYTKTKWSHQT